MCNANISVCMHMDLQHAYYMHTPLGSIFIVVAVVVVVVVVMSTLELAPDPIALPLDTSLESGMGLESQRALAPVMEPACAVGVGVSAEVFVGVALDAATEDSPA